MIAYFCGIANSFLLKYHKNYAIVIIVKIASISKRFTYTTKKFWKKTKKHLTNAYCQCIITKHSTRGHHSTEKYRQMKFK